MDDATDSGTIIKAPCKPLMMQQRKTSITLRTFHHKHPGQDLPGKCHRANVRPAQIQVQVYKHKNRQASQEE